ncbi:unnamed protein product [Trichobilharzia szidati]|nr:unnamed protein product [Trichobilharzia szidati]
MSSIATSGVVPSQIVGNIAEGTNSTLVQKPLKNVQDYESDSESDTSTDIEDDSSDDDKRLADNPILKERLKQLDRYATPIKHHTHSPVQIIDQHPIPGIYATNVPPDNTPNNGSLSIHGKSSGPSELMDSSLTPPEYRSHQFSAADSPTPCSSSASLGTSITSKHNLSPPNTILGTSTNVSGPISQHEIPDVSVYAHSSNSLSCKSSEIPSTYTYGQSLNSSNLIHSTDVCYNEVGDNQACVCEVCHVVYANRSSLRSHMKKHLNQSIKRHQCDQCPYSTQYGKNLFKHIESMHTVDSCQEYRCEGCTRSFTNEDLLRDHDCIVTQYNTYRCSECGRVFKTKLRLKYHADVHNPRKPYVCDIDGCDRAFRTPKYLKNHRDEFHRMHPKNYACPVGQCDLIFHRKTHLKRHIATHDDSEKKYQCQWPNCQRRFCTEETLNLHHSKHTGERPFNCSLCLYNCYDKPSLNEHYQVNHAKDANFDYNFKDLIHRIPSTTHSSQYLSETQGYRGSCGGDDDTRAFVARTSTPVSTVRHRMADILDSCTPDIPGPLDAEINGILDSLDKESDLPDLFSNGTLEMNRSGTEQNFTNNTNLNSTIQVSPYRQNSQSSCLATLPPSSSVNSVNAESGTSESSLTSLLPNILSELQRAELSGSNEEFEKVKSHVLSVLPTFVIGDKLSTQINEIVDEVNDALLDQPLHVIRAAFYTTRPFNREELYMIDLLEQQMLSESSSLTAPNPPRRRGRRPKLQQQLQPYLQRIFSLESGAAESMASHLVNASQKEKYINHYGYYRSTGFGRGRGRGKSGKHPPPPHPVSNVKPPSSDVSMSKNNQYNQSVYHHHNSGGVNMCTNGVVKRGRADSCCTQGEYCIEQISDDMHTGFPNDISTTEQYHTRAGVMHTSNHPNDLRTTHTGMFLNSYNYYSTRFHCPSEINRLDMSRISQNSNEDELNESEDDTPTNTTFNNNNNNNNNNMTHQFMYNQSRTVTDHEDHKGRDYDMKNDTQNSNNRTNSSHNEKDFMNQDTIGEMLEDLGVIVQKIGERAVARKQHHHQHQHHAEGQPLNLSDFAGGKQPCDSMNNRHCFNRNEANSHSIQLPSMATLASGSGSVDTPPSVEETSSISNPETPHLSAASYHALSSLKSFNAYNQTGISLSDGGTKNTAVPGSTSASISNTSSQAVYNSLTNNYHRNAPMWSCESMCFSSTREDELRKSDQTHITNNFNPQTRNSQSTRDFSNKPNGDMLQSYYPKDLSTRVQPFGSRSDSIHQSQHSPKDFTRSSESNDPNFNDIISGSLRSHHPAHLPNKASSGSLISTAEAVDHLRSLSALGAKYTACLEMQQEESRYQSNQQRLFPEDYAYNQSQIHSSDAALRRNPTEQGGEPQMSHNSARIPTSNILGYNVPSALNNLLYSK